MSVTTTAANPTSTCTTSDWTIPVRDAACAAHLTRDNVADAFDECCGDASIERYNDDCSVYCLAQGQTIGSLVDCLVENGIPHGQGVCNNGTNATATSKPTASKTDSEDSAESTSDADSDDNDDDDDDSSGGDEDVAGRTVVTASGLGLVALMFCTVILGTFA